MKSRILNLPTPAAQRVVVLLLLKGLNNRAIAQQLVIIHRAVECLISRALRKISCRNRLELTLGLIRDVDPEWNRQAAGTMQPMPA